MTRCTVDVILINEQRIYSGDGARSGLIPAIFVLVAASSLRCRPLLIDYVTILAMFSYSLLWIDTVFRRQEEVGTLTGVPALLAIALIGVVQSIGLIRSSASFESRNDSLTGRTRSDFAWGNSNPSHSEFLLVRIESALRA